MTALECKGFEGKPTYGLLQDKADEHWTVFRMPGSINDCPLSSSSQIKLRQLLEELGLKVDLFYQTINYEPKKGTFDYYWWPSYLIYKKLKNPGSAREEITDSALIDVITESRDYQNFVNSFYDFIKR